MVRKYTSKNRRKFSMKVHIILVIKYCRPSLSGIVEACAKDKITKLCAKHNWEMVTMGTDWDHLHIIKKNRRIKMNEENKKYFDEILIKQPWDQEDDIVIKFLKKALHDKNFQSWDAPEITKPKKYSLTEMLKSDGWEQDPTNNTTYRKTYEGKINAAVFLNGHGRVCTICVNVDPNIDIDKNKYYDNVIHKYYGGPGICIPPDFLGSFLTKERIAFLCDLCEYVENDLLLYVKKQKRKADVLCAQIKSSMPQGYDCSHHISKYMPNPELHIISIEISPGRVLGYKGLELTYIYDTLASTNVSEDIEKINNIVQAGIRLQNEVSGNMHNVRLAL